MSDQSTEGCMQQSWSVYDNLHEKQFHLHEQKQKAPLTFWSPFTKLRETPRQTGEKTWRMRKRCAQACCDVVTSHATYQLSKRDPGSKCGRRERQSPARCSVSSLWRWPDVLYQCPMWAVCQASCSEALPYLLSKQASLESKRLWISRIGEETGTKSSGTG